MEHSVWIDAAASEGQTRVILALCGLDPNTTHKAIRSSMDKFVRGEFHHVEDIIYLLNMINSDYIPYLDCIREGLLRAVQ